jgi:hypothetical protein
MSIKNKSSLEQCRYKRRNNSEYCGIHIKQIKVNRIDNLEIKLYTFDEIIQNNDLNLQSLLKTITKYNLSLLIEDTYSKNIIIERFQKLINKLKYWNDNINKIIKIQSIIRGNNVKNMYGYGLLHRNKCINNEDFYTFEQKDNISIDYFFSYMDNGICYCFDIRSFILLLSKNNINPYTRDPISDTIHHYVDIRKKYMSTNNIPYEIEIDILTDEQQLRNNMISVFNKYDQLGNYTNHEWLFELSLNQLKKLYIGAEDIWNYRASLSNIQKSRIISTSIPFSIPPSTIVHFNDSQKNKLQEIILYEFNRFVSEGINESEKKLGALLMLTALVEVSTNAALSYPHLIQNF